MKVVNKKIIVTGAGSGIGRELTLKLLAKGSSVIAVDINGTALEETKKLTNNNENLQLFIVDISSEESINKFKEDYFKANDKIDGLINNAGIIQKFIYVNNLDMTEINKVMNVNFFGMLRLTKAFLPYMLKNEEAHIVNISSMGGFFPFPGQTVYGASKAAVKIFSEGLYAELLDSKVRVTTVFPGAIRTNIAKNSGIEMTSSNNSAMKMTEANVAASLIIDAMEKNKFQVYVGSDAKFMNLLYKINPESAIKYINKKMKEMLK